MNTEQATKEVSVKIQDIYSWRASYGGTKHLDEENAAGGFSSVDQERCTDLTLLYMGLVPVHTVHIPQGAKPVFFRRRRIAINATDETGKPQAAVHCIGWKRSEEDAVYLFVFADGTTLLTNDLQGG